MKRKKGLELAVEMIPPLESEVTNVNSETELFEVSRLDAMAYGGESINHEGLRAWWIAYPEGIYVLWRGSEIVGAVGIWPIKKRTYDAILRGEIDEVDITAKDICRTAADKTYAYWYFADIVIREDHRDTDEEWHLFLLEEAIKQWSCRGSLTPEVHLCALGFTPVGIALLQKFRFLPVGLSPVHSRGGKPVYQRTVDVEDIRQALERLNVTRNEVRDYQVFISYRRADAGHLASKIHAGLEKTGLKVFMDRPDLGQGCFATNLREALAESQHFILILSPGCFNKRRVKVDYFKEEIALALENEKKIIPIFMEGFTYPSRTGWRKYIRKLTTLQSIDLAHEEPDTLIDKIMALIRS